MTRIGIGFIDSDRTSSSGVRSKPGEHVERLSQDQIKRLQDIARNAVPKHRAYAGVFKEHIETALPESFLDRPLLRFRAK